MRSLLSLRAARLHAELLGAVRLLEGIPADQRFALRGDVLLFRGTISWRDLLAEARGGRVRPWADEPARVHRGFHDLYSDIRPALLARTEGAPVRTICGHSLGGAFALLCANDMRRLGRPPPRLVVTVGAPRVGNRALAELVAREWDALRLVNDADAVSMLPPFCWHAGRHVPMRFDAGSLRGNHCLEGYEAALAAADPEALLGGVLRTAEREAEREAEEAEEAGEAGQEEAR